MNDENDNTVVCVENNQNPGHSSGNKSNYNKIPINFLQALEFIKSSQSMKILPPKSLKNAYKDQFSLSKKKESDTFDNGCSEYSKTEANFSKEEHINYPPVKKNVSISNNTLIKQNYKSNNVLANIPYECISKAVAHEEYKKGGTLKKGVEINSHRNPFEPDDRKKDKENFRSILGNNSMKNKKAPTTCQTKEFVSENIKIITSEELKNLNSNDRQNMNDSLSIKSFKNDLNDLDEIKEVQIEKLEKASKDVSIKTRKLNLKDLRNLRTIERTEKVLIGSHENLNIFGYSSGSGEKSQKVKINQSIISSKGNFSKILVVDSLNNSKNNFVEFNTDEKLNTTFKVNDTNEGGVFNLSGLNFFKNEGIDKSTLAYNYQESHTVSKQVRISRIDRKKTQNSILEENKYALTDKNKKTMQIFKQSIISNTQQTSENVSQIIEKLKNNFNDKTENISRNSSLVASQSSSRVRRNLLDRFNQIKEKKETQLISQRDGLFTPMKVSIRKFDSFMKGAYMTPEKSKSSKRHSEINIRPKSRISVDSYNKNDENEVPCNSIFDLEFVNNLLKKSEEFSIDPNYFEYHPLLTPEYRSILVNWLMELSEEFAFKRDTFHYSAYYIDLFLSKTKNFSNTKLQLLGVISLSLSAKIEEIQIPKCEEYISATDHSFSVEEFIEFEKYFIKAIEWKLLPPTLNLWLNWYLCQWDVFLDSFEDLRDRLIQNLVDNTLYFKKPDEKSYYLFRNITQVIDLIVLDKQHFLFNHRLIVAAAIFLVLGFSIQAFSPDHNGYDVDFVVEITKNTDFAEVFEEFLSQSFGFMIEEIYDPIVYVSKFFNIKFSTDLPLIAQTNEDIVNQGHYEEFLSYQCYNQENYNFITNLNK